MSRSRRRLGTVVVALTLANAGASALAAHPAWAGSVVEHPVAQGATPPATAPIVTATLDPDIVLFGDTLTARVDVLVDPAVVDPSTIAVRWNPTPWQSVQPPRRTVAAAGSTADVRMTYVLRCLTSLCAPARDTEHIHLPQARVSYLAPESHGTPTVVRAPWRTLIVHTRVGDPDPSNRDGRAAPWGADLVNLPPATFRVPPWLAIVVLVCTGVLLLAAAVAILIRAWPRAVPEVEPEVEPEPEPVPSALEQALAVLERKGEDGVEERRRALELVADEAERVGDRDLALDARALAWSSATPRALRTRALAVVLRERLAPLLEADEVGVNGGDPAERTNGAR